MSTETSDMNRAMAAPIARFPGSHTIFGICFIIFLACSVAVKKTDIRFTDNGDGTITDKKTHLTWQKCTCDLYRDDCARGKKLTLTWKDAVSYCALLKKKEFRVDRKEWRLPTALELVTLVNYESETEVIRADFFPNTANAKYWSSTIYAGDPEYGWTVSFNDGEIAAFLKAGDHHVRCVSGPEVSPVP